MGPINIGNTTTLNGTYEIIYKPNILTDWGTQEYNSWFTKHTVGWCKARAAKGLLILAQRSWNDIEGKKDH